MSRPGKPLRVVSYLDLLELRDLLELKWGVLGPELSARLFVLLNNLFLDQHLTTDEKHLKRYMAVCEGRFGEKLTWVESYTYASVQLDGELGAGDSSTMEKSYKKIRKLLRESGFGSELPKPTRVF